MEHLKHYLIFTIMTLSTANVFAYGIKIKNNSSLAITAIVALASAFCSDKVQVIAPGTIWETGTGGCCTTQVKLSSGVFETTYTPTLTLGMACHGYEITVSADLNKPLPEALSVQEGIH